jgi:hypothetical protein
MASPADIITYIGIPIAVLGVSPIIYNFIIAYLTRLKLVRNLKALGIHKDTSIRSRLFNGVVQLGLPVYDLELEGCPNVRAHFRGISVRALDGVQGGTWTQFTYPRREVTQPYLEQYRVGHITKEFQISSELSLPEASVRFEDLLEYLLQTEWESPIEFESEGFMALKFQNFNVQTETKLLSVAKKSLKQSLDLTTARSSPNTRGFLCLKVDVHGIWNVKDPHIPLQTINEADYFSQMEIREWGSLHLQRKDVVQPQDDIWIAKSNRYFIREPSSPAGTKSTAHDGTNDAKRPVNEVIRAIASKLETQVGRASGKKTDLHVSKDEALGHRDLNQPAHAKEKTTLDGVDTAQNTRVRPIPNTSEFATANVLAATSKPLLDDPSIATTSEEKLERDSKAGVHTSDPEGKSTAMLTLQENTPARQNPLSAEKMLSYPPPPPPPPPTKPNLPYPAGPSFAQQPPRPLSLENVSATKSNSPGLLPEAIPPIRSKKGIYIWIGSDSVIKVFGINGDGPNDELVLIKEVDHVMEATKGLSNHIEIDERIFENNILKHVFAAHFELENPSKLPKFKYQPEVLYKMIFGFISLGLLERFKVDLNDLITKFEQAGAHSANPTAAGMDNILGNERERELESVINSKVLSNNREKGEHILNKDKEYFALWYEATHGKPRPGKQRHLHLNVPGVLEYTRYIRLAELRQYLNHSLWEDSFSKVHLLHRGDGLSRSKVPTTEEILYWILENRNFASQVVKCLDAIWGEMGIEHEKVSSLGPEFDDNLIFFFCAVTLIDAVAKKAERFMLIDDIQFCLKKFPRVYIH